MRGVGRLMLVLLLVLVPLAAGCGDDADDPIPECEAIAEACHPVDPGTGPIHECHENAEAASTGPCVSLPATAASTAVATPTELAALRSRCSPAAPGGV